MATKSDRSVHFKQEVQCLLKQKPCTIIVTDTDALNNNDNNDNYDSDNGKELPNIRNLLKKTSLPGAVTPQGGGGLAPGIFQWCRLLTSFGAEPSADQVGMKMFLERLYKYCNYFLQ